MIGGISIPAGSARPRMNQLLNHVIDEIAAAEPDSPCLEIPVSEATYELGFRSVTRQQFASAVNGAAWWLEESLGRGRDFQTLAYFGPWDVRYNILLFAAVKVGYKVRWYSNFDVRWRLILSADVLPFSSIQCQRRSALTPGSRL